jgi:hypothetical protein
MRDSSRQIKHILIPNSGPVDDPNSQDPSHLEHESKEEKLENSSTPRRPIGTPTAIS